jgi:hypothetical protein
MSNLSLHQQPWIGKPFTEVCFILLPPFCCLLLIALFPAVFQNVADVSVSWWVILILLVDVQHFIQNLF